MEPHHELPFPDNTEAGCGAVTEDGIIVLNEPLVRVRVSFCRSRIL